jgi:CO/xanthine dehydrogenase FAD-binding subunit
MIPFDFVYCRPTTLTEAAETYVQLQQEGKNPVYYAGGSEIITMCRTGSIQPGAVIDIKNIPECMLLSVDDKNLHIGSACTLNQISESKLFPLLRLSCGRIADHTNQCRITLGGNLCGTIIYRETSLPLLLSDEEVTLISPKGERTVPFQSVFNGCMVLRPGEMIVQIHVPVWALSARCFHMKKTANEKIDYPLVSVAAIQKDNYLRVALSGVCSCPYRNEQMEAVLNGRAKSREERAKTAAGLLSETVYSDAEGSGEYRIFVLKNTLQELLEDWENGTI